MRCDSSGAEALELIKERHLLDFFLGIFFDLGFLARDLGFVNFALALVREIGAGAHRKRGGHHAGETGDENVMLLIIGRAGDAGDDAEDRAEAVVHAVNRVRHPAAAAAMPAFAFQNGVEQTFRA